MSLDYLYTAVSWVLLRWHDLFNLVGLPSNGGLNWALSIVFLVVTARLLLFRFFIKQVHYQRHMQEMQPRIKKLQEKHKGDKATLQREMMALQQAEGFNPLSGCLPMLLQLPIFISLFHVLKHMSAAVSPGYPERKKTLYGFTTKQLNEAAHAKLFGAPLAASLRESSTKVTDVLNGNITSTRIVIIVLVLISAAATLITQRAVIANATTPAEGQAATIQRLMSIGIPLSVIGSGLFFPLGVLLYWFTSNVWTMGQQFYIFRFHPHVPGAAGGSGGSGAEDKAATPKSVAPRPGQKPTSNGRRGAAVAPAGDSVSLDKSSDRDAGKGGPRAKDSAHGTAAANKAAPSVGDKEVRTPKPMARAANRPASASARRGPNKKRR